MTQSNIGQFQEPVAQPKSLGRSSQPIFGGGCTWQSIIRRWIGVFSGLGFLHHIEKNLIFHWGRWRSGVLELETGRRCPPRRGPKIRVLLGCFGL
jgi:hypothetical protein